MKKTRNISINIDSSMFLEKYRKYIQSKNLKRINVFYGGVGSGKSYFLAQLIIYRSLKIPKRKTLVLRKYRTTMEHTVIREIMDAIERMGLEDLIEYNKTKGVITFPNKSKIIFMGYDNPEKVKGIKYHDLWMEEVTDFNSYADGTNDFTQIMERLRGSDVKNPRVFISFNPIQVTHWVRKEFFSEHDPHTPKNNKIMVCRSTYKDNPFYGTEALELLLEIRENNPRRWKIVGEGDWGVLGELIFEGYEIFEEHHSDDWYDNIAYGCDFGFAHKTGFVKIGIKGNNIYVIKEIYEDKLTASELIEEIKNKFPKDEWWNMTIIADSARPEIIKEMKKNDLYTKPSKKGPGSVLDGIEWIQDRKVFIHKDCTGTIGEAEAYQWQHDKKTGVKQEKPVKTEDDLMDAIRYATETFKRNGRVS